MFYKEIHIKNMVCDRCIASVKNILEKLDIPYTEVQLGKALINTDTIPYQELDRLLQKEGFELVKDKNNEIIEQIKAAVIKRIHYADDEAFTNNFSEYLQSETGLDYSRLSKIFSASENITIEKYIILQKIEKVKELIAYNELNFTEIAYRLGYSSSAYLSKQFKEITGYTLSQYKKLPENQRKTLDKLGK